MQNWSINNLATYKTIIMLQLYNMSIISHCYYFFPVYHLLYKLSQSHRDIFYTGLESGLLDPK